MGRKPKFKPEITRVKLNPEQAVLTCFCYNTGYWGGVFGNITIAPSCFVASKSIRAELVTAFVNFSSS